MLKLEIDINDSICNLKCDYCILTKRNMNNNNGKNINYDNILSFITKYIIFNNYQNVELRFTACEPMTIIEKILRTIEVIKSIPIVNNLNLLLVTNSTIVPEKELFLISQMVNTNLIISLDSLDEYQHYRKYKDGTNVKTSDILNNAEKIKNILHTDTYAISTVVKKDRTFDSLKKQIDFFKSKGINSLLTKDAFELNELDERVEKLVNQYNSSCGLECLMYEDMICIDTAGNIYMCRSEKTAGMKPKFSIFDKNAKMYKPYINVRNVYNELKNKYGDIKICPFWYYKKGVLNEC